MARQLPLAALSVALSVLFSGCATMPTPPSQIAASYVSELQYENLDCSQLYVELDSLAARERQLVIAQEQRRKASQKQAFWTGYGPPDGIEAYRLAKVRGEKDAVRRVMQAKKCNVLAALGTEPEADTSGRRIIGYLSVTGKKDARGNPVFVPIYAAEPKK